MLYEIFLFNKRTLKKIKNITRQKHMFVILSKANMGDYYGRFKTKYSVCKRSGT